MWRKDHGSWCRWCLWSWLALAWLPLTPAPAPEPCSGNTILEMIRDYAPDCISSCPDICTPLGGLIFSVFAGEMNATKLICPEWEIFSCMAKTEEVLEFCTPLLDAALIYVGIDLPRSDAQLRGLCGVAPATTVAPATAPPTTEANSGPTTENTGTTEAPSTSSTTEDDDHNDDDDDEEEDSSLSVQSATAFTPSSAQGQPYTFTNTTTSTQTTTVFETETMTQTTSVTTVVSVTHTTTVATTTTSTRETFGSVDAVSAAKGIRLSGTRGTVRRCNSFKFSTPNSFISC